MRYFLFFLKLGDILKWRRAIAICLAISLSGCVSFTELRYIPDNPENGPDVEVKWSSSELVPKSDQFTFLRKYVIAADAKGRALVVWATSTSQSSVGEDHEFWSSFRDRDGWPEPTCFHEVVNACGTDLCDLCVDKDGNFHVLYRHREFARRGASTEYWLQTLTNGHWLPPEKAIKGAFGLKGQGAICADAHGVLHAVCTGRYRAEMGGYGVFHGQFPHKLFYVRRESGHWSPHVEINKVGRYYARRPSLAADSTGDLHLAYERSNLGGCREISYQRFQNGVWHRAVRFGRSDMHHAPARVVSDREDKPHIIWAAPTNSIARTIICHAYEANGKWSLEIIGAGFAPSAVADNFGNIHVAWFGNGDVFSHRCWSNGRWSRTNVIAAGNPGPLAVGPGDTLHAIWTQVGIRYMRGLVKRGSSE